MSPYDKDDKDMAVKKRIVKIKGSKGWQWMLLPSMSIRS